MPRCPRLRRSEPARDSGARARARREGRVRRARSQRRAFDGVQDRRRVRRAREEPRRANTHAHREAASPPRARRKPAARARRAPGSESSRWVSCAARADRERTRRARARRGGDVVSDGAQMHPPMRATARTDARPRGVAHTFWIRRGSSPIVHPSLLDDLDRALPDGPVSESLTGRSGFRQPSSGPRHGRRLDLALLGNARACTGPGCAADKQHNVCQVGVRCLECVVREPCRVESDQAISAISGPRPVAMGDRPVNQRESCPSVVSARRRASSSSCARGEGEAAARRRSQPREAACARAGARRRAPRERRRPGAARGGRAVLTRAARARAARLAHRARGRARGERRRRTLAVTERHDVAEAA